MAALKADHHGEDQKKSVDLKMRWRRRKKKYDSRKAEDETLTVASTTC